MEQLIAQAREAKKAYHAELGKVNHSNHGVRQQLKIEKLHNEWKTAERALLAAIYKGE